MWGFVKGVSTILTPFGDDTDANLGIAWNWFAFTFLSLITLAIGGLTLIVVVVAPVEYYFAYLRVREVETK